MRRRRTAAATVYVYQTLCRHLLSHLSEGLRCLVVAAHHIRQSSVRMHADRAWRYVRQPAQPRQQLLGTETTVKAYRQQVAVCQRSTVSLHRLTAQCATGCIRQRTAAHDRYVQSALLAKVCDSLQRRLCVKGVEDSLNEQYVGTAVNESACLLVVSVIELFKGNISVCRVIHIAAHRQRAVGRTNGAGDD